MAHADAAGQAAKLVDALRLPDVQIGADEQLLVNGQVSLFKVIEIPRRRLGIAPDPRRIDGGGVAFAFAPAAVADVGRRRRRAQSHLPNPIDAAVRESGGGRRVC